MSGYGRRPGRGVAVGVQVGMRSAGKTKPSRLNDPRPRVQGDGGVEYRAGVDEGVELAVLRRSGRRPVGRSGEQFACRKARNPRKTDRAWSGRRRSRVASNPASMKFIRERFVVSRGPRSETAHALPVSREAVFFRDKARRSSKEEVAVGDGVGAGELGCGERLASIRCS